MVSLVREEETGERVEVDRITDICLALELMFDYLFTCAEFGYRIELSNRPDGGYVVCDDMGSVEWIGILQDPTNIDLGSD